jgi:MFS family permease
MFRFLLGIGEAGNWPAGVKVVTEWFPGRERALASGIFNSGSAVGAILAPPIVAWILLRYGWPSAFVAVGSAGLFWLVLWLPAYRAPHAAAAEIQALPIMGSTASNRILDYLLPAKRIDFLSQSLSWKSRTASVANSLPDLPSPRQISRSSSRRCSNVRGSRATHF